MLKLGYLSHFDYFLIRVWYFFIIIFEAIITFLKMKASMK